MTSNEDISTNNMEDQKQKEEKDESDFEECDVLKVVSKRFNNRKKRDEWKTQWGDGSFTWEPKHCFLDFVSGEEVVNEKWRTFEDEHQKNKMETGKVKPKKARTPRQPRRQVVSPPKEPVLLMDKKRQALRTVKKIEKNEISPENKLSPDDLFPENIKIQELQNMELFPESSEKIKDSKEKIEEKLEKIDEKLGKINEILEKAGQLEKSEILGISDNTVPEEKEHNLQQNNFTNTPMPTPIPVPNSEIFYPDMVQNSIPLIFPEMMVEKSGNSGEIKFSETVRSRRNSQKPVKRQITATYGYELSEEDEPPKKKAKNSKKFTSKTKIF